MTMESTVLGRTPIKVSRMGLGGNRLGGLPGTRQRRRSVAIVERALAAGVRLFDTADAYGSGTSEAVLGEVLSGEDDAVIATKIGYTFADRSTITGVGRDVLNRARRHGSGAYRKQDFSPGAVEAAVEGSCRRLRRDRVDLLQLHGPPPAASSVLPEVIEQLRAAGRIGAFGVGCESLAVATTWLEVDGLDCVQLPFGVLDPQAGQGLLDDAHRRGVGVLVRGVLGGGVLGRHLRSDPTGLEPERDVRLHRLEDLASRLRVDLGQLAVWFVRQPPAVDSVLLGVTSLDQLDQCVRWSTAPLPEAAVLDEIASIIGLDAT